MAHSIEPVLPFNLTKATFLVLELEKPLSHVNLIAIRGQQLKKWESGLALIKECVLNAWYTSIAQFEKENANLIKDYNF